MTEAVTLSAAPADLPLEVTTFVGRRSDRRRIRELMSKSRLVTLTGFGGYGKSRLALRMAAELQRRFDGVYVVALGSVSDPENVPDQIGAALGLHGRRRQSATIGIVEYLRPRTALLLLDNCEHVIDVAAAVADTLLRTCPDVRILATSREPLRIGGEVEYAVAPLTSPGHLSGAEPLHQYEAVQLFLDRARSIIPDFTLTDDNRDAVAAISRKLEGIPLAIELAAARLRAFSPAELNANLTDQWELLSRGSRTAPDRHSTMAACIEWSFNLCTPAQRSLWAKAAVFSDGFELDAAKWICSDRDEEPIAETLASLVEKSVLICHRNESANRYRMLPPIRHRGRVELIRIGRNAELALRHKDFYLRLVAQAHDEWFGPRQLDWISRLRREGGNIGKAMELCAAEPEIADEGLKAGASLLQMGLVEGRFQQGRRWFDRILAIRHGDPETRVLALRTACLWSAVQGERDSASALLDEARTLATQLSDETQTLVTQAAGFVALFAGDLHEARRLLDEARPGFAAIGNTAELAFCSALLALDCAVLGDFSAALQHHRDCMALTESAGETWLRSWSQWIAGLVMCNRGETTDAEDLVMQSLRLKRLIADPLGIAVCLDTLGWVSAATQPERFATLLGAAQNEWDKIDTDAQILPGVGTKHRELTHSARTLLGAQAFDQARLHGRALDRATAIALALNERPTAKAKETPGLATRGVHPVLTRRELQIAELIHKGLSNKQIADTLVISPRTAESHVENILTKLGFTNRTQVAAWIGEQLPAGDR